MPKTMRAIAIQLVGKHPMTLEELHTVGRRTGLIGDNPMSDLDSALEELADAQMIHISWSNEQEITRIGDGDWEMKCVPKKVYRYLDQVEITMNILDGPETRVL